MAHPCQLTRRCFELRFMTDVPPTRYHPKFPNVPLSRNLVGDGDVGKWNCDVSSSAAQPGDAVWCNRAHDVDILEQFMPAADVRFHPKYPGVPLTRGLVRDADAGKLTCDVTDTLAQPGQVLWSNRERDIDVLDPSMPPPPARPAPEGAPDLPVSIGPGAVRAVVPTGAVGAANLMGIELLQAICAGKTTSSAFVSPLSISLALAMTANGAQGPTLDGMLTALSATGLGGLDVLNREMQRLTGALSSTDRRVAFHLANSLWSVSLLGSFHALCADVFRAEAHRSRPMAAPINQWCAKQTRGKITQVLDPGAPLDPMGAVLVNALYFKGEWKEKFEERMTSQAEFRGSHGPRPCHMMSAKGEKGKFLYTETDLYQAVALPYGAGGAYSAVILLPREGPAATLVMGGRGGKGGSVPAGASKAPRAASVGDVLAVAASDWPDLFQRMVMVKGTLSFPRFKVEFGLDLKPLLQARGMGQAFEDAADFSKMSSKPLKIDAVIHKTFVEVNEQGTEAAAVTAVMMSRGCAMPLPEPIFTMLCNRPFLFFIRHDSSDAMLFAGVVSSV